MAPRQSVGGTQPLRSQIWFIPMMSLAIATILAFVTTAVDRRLAGDNLFRDLFSRNPEAVRTALSVVASSILTFTALVFTITMVVVQQAANRLSPRVIPAFLADRMSQVTLGLFMGTFAYSLLVLRDVRSPSEGVSFVPGISVSLVFVAVLVSLGVFVSYLNHIVESLQASHIADRIAAETAAEIDRVYPEHRQGPPPPVPADSDMSHQIRWWGAPGVLTIDSDALAEIAGDGVVAVVPVVGDFIQRGDVLIRSSSDLGRADLDGAVGTRPARSIRGDIRFGLRQLIDIAERGLSPGINDPTTAVEAIDRIHTLLRMLVGRLVPSPHVHETPAGGVLILSSPTVGDYVALALEELILYGAGSLQVTRKVESMLDALRPVAIEDEGQHVIDAMANHLAREVAGHSVGSWAEFRRDGQAKAEL